MNQTFDPVTASMTVMIASTDYALRAVVVPFLRRLISGSPVQPVDNQQLLSQLDHGEVDLALVTPESTAAGLVRSVRCR